MRITEQELNDMIESLVESKIQKLNEGTDFTAKRKIILSAQNASIEFENEIKSLLNLVDPDSMPSQFQVKYFQIAESMKTGIVKAVAEAVSDFAKLPRNDEGGK